MTWCTNWYCSHVWIMPPLASRDAVGCGRGPQTLGVPAILSVPSFRGHTLISAPVLSTSCLSCLPPESCLDSALFHFFFSVPHLPYRLHLVCQQSLSSCTHHTATLSSPDQWLTCPDGAGMWSLGCPRRPHVAAAGSRCWWR